jgi:agmatine deiminase
MAWAVHREWGASTDAVKRELREIIVTVAQYEPVRLLTPPDQISEAKAQAFGDNVEIISAPVDDVWMRDIAPSFAWRGDQVVAIDWNFNGWGSTPERPTRPGDRLAGLIARDLGIPYVHATFIAEGGSFLTDGEGTIITSKSCLLNPNRNPSSGRSVTQQLAEIEREFSYLGGRKIIWLEGNSDEPVTSGHVDAFVMFTAPGAILVDEWDSELNHAADIKALLGTRDAQNRLLSITAVLPPRQKYWRFSSISFAPCYLNAYIANGAVITGKFGDPERDEAAYDTLVESFPGRDIRMLPIDHIARGGGGVHCLTQPFPAVLR